MQFAEARKLVEIKDTHDKWGIWEEPARPGYDRGGYKKVEVTIPAGTVIECDRVYIRSFNKARLELGNDYDSITWKVIKGTKVARHGRFWTKLSDCNGLEFELESDSLYRDRVKSVKVVMES